MKKWFAASMAFMAVLLVASVFALAAAVVNINTADVKALASIPKIGPKKAQAIIDYRKNQGPFKSVDDLVKVKGIGKKTLAKIREFIAVK